MPCDCCMLDWDFNIIGYDCANTDGPSWGECISTSAGDHDEDEFDINDKEDYTVFTSAPDSEYVDIEDAGSGQDSYVPENDEDFISEESINEQVSSTMSTTATNIRHDNTPGMPSPDEWQDLYDELAGNGNASSTFFVSTNNAMILPVIVVFILHFLRSKVFH